MTSLGSNTAKSYFYEAVTSAIGRLGISVEQIVEFYLVEVLTKKAFAQDDLEEPLAFQLSKAREAASDLERFYLYRKAGDSALFLLGFFSDFLERKGVHRSYVTTIGGSAYANAAGLSPKGFNKVYYDLSDGFDEFALVLDEVKESTVMRTPQDILKLYDKWQRTKSPAAEERLRKEGVFPLRKKT